MIAAEKVLNHWERHGKFQQTEADECFGEPTEVTLAREVIMLREACRMALDFIDNGQTSLGTSAIQATLNVLDNPPRQ